MQSLRVAHVALTYRAPDASLLLCVQWMGEALGELGLKCDLVEASDGSSIGAALVALAASKGLAVKAVRTE